MIKFVKQVSIPVKDQDRSLEFYTTKLGFTVAVDAQLEGGGRWIELKMQATNLEIVLFTPEGHEDRIGTLSNISFASDDVQKTYEELLAKGVEFVHPPKEAPWGLYTLFKDPDNNTFCLGMA
jgi:predicted enzyme related to lactoylglutathione lyase